MALSIRRPTAAYTPAGKTPSCASSPKGFDELSLDCTRTKILDALVNDSLAAFSTNNDGHQQLTLTPDKGSFSVDFDVINYDLTGTNQYFYKLTPGDKDWRKSEGGHLSFYNLQPGSYTLEVKGASKLTGNFTNTDNLDILVNPYWYQSTGFRVSSLLFLCLLASWLVRYRIRSVRKEGAFKQKMTEMEMTAPSNAK